jgi:23S rRNA (cytidine1920-2'-O)/16S rRNA (cytidine1409-2'-O)-methyltransferase
LGAGKKHRLDGLLVAQGAAENIDSARRLIGAGSVLVNETVCDKVGTLVAESARITVKVGKKYVSRGGDKLQSALKGLPLNPSNWVCADIGSSTGGFTDCLLQHGARQVFCVDVGYGLLDWKLRTDQRVVVLERTNARYLSREHIPTPIDLAVIDASFISLEPLLPPLLPLFAGQPVRILALVKPQFQLPRELVEQGGVVTDEARHQQALTMVRQFGQQLGLCCEQVLPSGICGTKGNQEYFMLLTAPSGFEAGEAENG